MIDRALLIKEPWIEYILRGIKTWELRGSQTKLRGTIALAKSGTGLIIGTAVLTDCFKIDQKQFERETDKHQVLRWDDVPYATCWAWKLKDAVRFDKPVPYKHPMGAVIWVKLDEATQNQVGRSNRGRSCGVGCR